MRRLCIMLVAAIAYASAAAATASQIAFDSAGDSVYNIPPGNLVLPGTNGGYGWADGWQQYPSSFVSYTLTIGSSSTNGIGDPNETGDINSPRSPLGRAWDIRARTNGYPFNGVSRWFSGALQPGQTFQMDFDNGVLDAGSGFKVVVDLGGIELSAGQYNRMDYMLTAPGSAQPIDTGITVTDQGIHIELSLLDQSTADFSITPLASPASMVTLTVGYSPISNVSIGLASGDTVGPASDVYINNIAITPEPSSALPLLIVIAGQAFYSRKPR